MGLRWGDLGLSGNYLELSWGHLGLSWSYLGAILSSLGATWEFLGASLVYLAVILVPSWAILKLSRGHHELSGSYLGLSWGHPGLSWSYLVSFLSYLEAISGPSWALSLFSLPDLSSLSLSHSLSPSLSFLFRVLCKNSCSEFLGFSFVSFSSFGFKVGTPGVAQQNA